MRRHFSCALACFVIFVLAHSVASFVSASSPDKHAMLGAELYFMCDDLQATVKVLKDKKVACGPIGEERWGIKTTIRLPSGGERSGPLPA